MAESEEERAKRQEHEFWDKTHRFADAGMGFWRLACIIALGILIAHGITKALIWIVAQLLP